MIKNRYQGDPAITITQDGAKMYFIGGQPVMDQGLQNPVLISLFTKPGWWGNKFFTEDSKKIGSDYEDTCNEPIVALSSINNITDATDKALKWLKDIKLAKDINISVTNPRTNQISVAILITPPSDDISKLLFLKNGMSWVMQALDPAYKKFPEVN